MSHQTLWDSVPLSTHPPICSSIHPSIHPLTYLPAHPSIHPIFHYLLCVMHLLDAKAMKNFKRWALFSRNSKCRIVAELKTFSQNMWIYDRCSDGGLINAVPARGLQSSVCSEWEILFSQTPNLGIKWGGSITDEVLPLYLRQVTACCALSSLLNIFHTFFLNPHIYPELVLLFPFYR